MKAVPQPNDTPSWYEASARARLESLVDSGSFTELLGPEQRETSPHLSLFGLPVQFDDGLVAGAALLEGRKVLLAAQEGRFMGARLEKFTLPNWWASCARLDTYAEM